MEINPGTPSGDLTVGTTTVLARPGLLKNIALTAAAANCTLIVYDNASSAAGTVIGRLAAAANTCATLPYTDGVICNNGIVAVVAGTGAIANISFTIE